MDQPVIKYKKQKLEEHVEWLEEEINRELFYDEPISALNTTPPEVHDRRSLGLLSSQCDSLATWLLTKGLVRVLSGEAEGWSDVYAGFWAQYVSLFNMTKGFEVTTNRYADPRVLSNDVAHPLCCAFLFQQPKVVNHIAECTFRQPRMLTPDELGFIRFAAWIVGVDVVEHLPEPRNGPWRDLMHGRATINEKLACDLIDLHMYYMRDDTGNPIIFYAGEDLLFPVELVALSRAIPKLGVVFRALDFGPFDGRVWAVPPASEIAPTEELELLKKAMPA